MAGIKDALRGGEINNVYLMWGDEDFLRDYYASAITAKILDPSIKDFNFKEFNSRKPVNEEIAKFIDSYPCMSERKILYIKDSEIFKKANETDKKFWQDVFSDVPEYMTIIFSEKSVDKRSALYKAVTKNFVVDEFPYQKRADLINWIGRYLAKNQKSISRDCADYLIESCSESMYILKGEIEKLSCYKREAEITKEDIDRCCCKIPEGKVFEMIDFAVSGNIKKATEKYEELKAVRAEPIPVNAAIFSKYNQFYKEKRLSATMSPGQIALKTKQKEYFVKIHLKQISHMSLDSIKNILYLCSECDHNIKSGLADGWTSLDIIFANMLKG